MTASTTPAHDRRRHPTGAGEQAAVPADPAGGRSSWRWWRLAAGQDRPAVAAAAGSWQVRAVPQRRLHAVRRAPQLRQRPDRLGPSGRSSCRTLVFTVGQRRPRALLIGIGDRAAAEPDLPVGPLDPGRRAAVRLGGPVDGVDPDLLLVVQQPVRRRELPARPAPRRAHGGPRLVRGPAPGTGRGHRGGRLGSDPALAISLHAGITQIPREVLEAARCDGAGAWQAFRHVTLPFLRPLLVILTTLSVIWDFGVFNQIWFMRNGHPEPGYQTIGIFMYAQRDRQQPLQRRRDDRGADDDRPARRHGLLHQAAVPDRGLRVTDRRTTRHRARARTAGRPVRRPRQPARRRTRPAAGTRWRCCSAVVLGFPIYWMLITAFKTSADINQLVPQFWPHHLTLQRVHAGCSAIRSSAGRPAQQPDHHAGRRARSASSSASSAPLAIARFRFAGREVFVVRRADRADDPVAGIDDSDVAAARQVPAQEHADRCRSSPT